MQCIFVHVWVLLAASQLQQHSMPLAACHPLQDIPRLNGMFCVPAKVNEVQDQQTLERESSSISSFIAL
jgi:hypothetical protein